MQDLVPPLLALIAASAEVNAARNAPIMGRGMTPSRNSLASMTGFRRAGTGNLRALAWAAGAFLVGLPNPATTRAPAGSLEGISAHISR